MFSLHRRISIALAMAIGAVSLTGCVVEPAGYGGAYYAPAPVYVGPSVYYGPRYGGYYHGGGYWRGGGGWRR
jgi:hypothetical protein